uniref:Uncharacterized protein n=1 Tax=Strongyloides venezuelensis TaxID=75913 RepID=A0A0K0FGY6_STRVS
MILLKQWFNNLRISNANKTKLESPNQMELLMEINNQSWKVKASDDTKNNKTASEWKMKKHLSRKFQS